MSYVVSRREGSPRLLAAVRARVPVSQISRVFASHLDQVYATGRAHGLPLDGQNVFVYRSVPGSPDELDVDFGVGVASPFAAIGPVECVSLPTGAVATTTHRGDYAALVGAHAAVVDWCLANDHALAGPRWEVYGHMPADPSGPRTDVFWLLAPAGGRA